MLVRRNSQQFGGRDRFDTLFLYRPDEQPVQPPRVTHPGGHELRLIHVSLLDQHGAVGLADDSRFISVFSRDETTGFHLMMNDNIYPVYENNVLSYHNLLLEWINIFTAPETCREHGVDSVFHLPRPDGDGGAPPPIM